MTRELTKDFWLVIEPYVYIKIVDTHALLYNTLDKTVIESKEDIIIKLLKQIIQKNNNGIILLTEKQIHEDVINSFIKVLKEKFMGDIIEVCFSAAKPIQLLPFCNYADSDVLEIVRRHNFSTGRNVLDHLSEINIYIDMKTNIKKLNLFLRSIPDRFTINIRGDIEKYKKKYVELLTLLDTMVSQKNVYCSYKNVSILNRVYDSNISYYVDVAFPIDRRVLRFMQKMKKASDIHVEYVFKITSLEDYQNVEKLIDEYDIDNCHLEPLYTGKNYSFFENYVFLTKEDILSSDISIKDILSHQSLNTNDFGKITIMSDGSVFANPYFPSIGNIYSDSLPEIIQAELDKGQSWLRIRNQEPCNKCIFQWLCPSPSNYEIAIGRSNLCHIKN